MKTMSFVFLLVASMTFVLMGCSDDSAPTLPAASQSAASIEVGSLAKGPVVHSVTGSCNLWLFEKMGVATFSARQYEDGTVNGQCNVVTTACVHPICKLQMEVVALRFFPNSSFGNAAVIWGIEKFDQGLKGSYLVTFVADEPDLGGGFIGPYSGVDMNMTPEDIYAIWPEIYPNDVGQLVIH